MKLAILGIGLAGSGKTTILRDLAARRDLFYVSRDDIAAAFTGNPHHQDFRDLINTVADNAAMVALARGKSLVVDSTFVNYDKRVRKIIHLRLVGADRIIGVHFNTPLDIARRRNRNRRFSVPESILLRQFHELTEHPPSISDGFDMLYRATDLDELEVREFDS